jgi:hypothetical protein
VGCWTRRSPCERPTDPVAGVRALLLARIERSRPQSTPDNFFLNSFIEVFYRLSRYATRRALAELVFLWQNTGGARSGRSMYPDAKACCRSKNPIDGRGCL